MAKTTRTKPSECASCHAPLDAATFPFTGKHEPAAGDFTVCFYCRALSVFTADGLLRQPTYDEMQRAKRDPHVRYIRESIMKMNSMNN